MIIVENRVTDDLKIFTAETFWYDDTQGLLIIEETNRVSNVKVFIEDHWWGVKLKVYSKEQWGEA